MKVVEETFRQLVHVAQTEFCVYEIVIPWVVRLYVEIIHEL